MTNTFKKPKSLLKKYSKLAIVVLLLLALILFYVNRFGADKESPNYITTKVTKGNIEHNVMASGKIKAIHTVNVGAQVSGEVTKLYVKVGDIVKKGDLIAQIDEVTQQNKLSNSEASLLQSKANLTSALSALKSKQASLKNAQANLKNAQTNLIKAQANYKKAETYLKRLESLVAINAISKQDYDNAKTDLITATATLNSSQSGIETAQSNIVSAKADIESSLATIASQKASVKKAQNNVNTAQEDLSYTTIRAPMDGTIVSVTTKEGSTVNANQSAPTIVTLADLSQVRVNAQISEADVIKIKAGLPVYFNTVGNPDEKIYGTLKDIEPAPEKISTSSNVNSAIYYIGYVESPNPEGRFRIDMTAQVYIIIDEAKNVLTIPSSALKSKHSDAQNQEVQNKSKLASVQVVQPDGTIKNTDVQVGINNRVNAQIISGLNEGDEIVIGEANNIKNDELNKHGPSI